MTLPSVVIDTNWVLDLWVFADPASQALRDAVEQGQVRWLVCAPMRVELERVLAYPQVHKRLRRNQRSAQEVLAVFDRLAVCLPTPTSAPPRCKDPDDQVFIDLAREHQATLISKDGYVLKLNKALARLGVITTAMWPTPQKISLGINL